MIRSVKSLLLVAVSAHAARVTVERHHGGFDAHMERVHSKGWKSSEMDMTTKNSTRLELTFAVKQSNTELLEKRLMDVSDPRSSDFGRHLSMEEVDDLIAPSEESVHAVTEWLASYGLSAERVTGNGDFLNAIVTVEMAEALLNATFATFVHTSGESVTRTLTDYSLPAEVAAHVDIVTPTVTFPPLHRAPQRRNSVGNGKSVVTPSFLRKLYKMEDSDVGKGSASNNSQAVASFIKQYYDPKDLTAFWKKYPPPAPTPFTDVGVQSHKAEVEASIDSEYICATGAGVSTQMWYTAGVQPGNVENEPFIKWLTNVASTAAPPPIFSISYGDEEDGVSKDYAVRASTEFQKAGARGISLLAASGDSGAGCAAGSYVPTFPASSPYITAVGGLEGGGLAQEGGTGESAAALSGGGFSNYFDRPSFQDAAVADYLTHSLPAQNMWNKNGAGFPDISAQAIQYDTCSDDFFYPYDGTSCATPTVAGMIGVLNEIRAAAGKAPLGYLNPLLYTTWKGAGFNDITDGTNNYCDNPSGFPATKGWDAVTGFGSPDFSQLKAAVQSLP